MRRPLRASCIAKLVDGCSVAQVIGRATHGSGGFRTALDLIKSSWVGRLGRGEAAGGSSVLLGSHADKASGCGNDDVLVIGGDDALTFGSSSDGGTMFAFGMAAAALG